VYETIYHVVENMKEGWQQVKGALPIDDLHLRNVIYKHGNDRCNPKASKL
jgi:hypothetical protein